jgi:hypothetical protein
MIADIVEATAGYPCFLRSFGACLCRSVATPNVSVYAARPGAQTRARMV